MRALALAIGRAGLCPFAERWNKRSIEFQTEAGRDGWGREGEPGERGLAGTTKNHPALARSGTLPRRAKDRHKTPLTKPPGALALALV